MCYNNVLRMNILGRDAVYFFSGDPIMDKVKALLKSRRFWAAVGGVLIVTLQDVVGVPEDTAHTLVGIAVAWIVGDSIRITE